MSKPSPALVPCLVFVAATLLGGCGDDPEGPVAPETGGLPDGEPVYVFDKADLDALAGVTRIDGILYVQSGCDTCVVDDLAPLSALVGVGGLVIGNTAIRDLAGLEGLETCDGELRIWGNDQLRTLAGLESLTTVGSVELLGNPVLESVAALAAIDPMRLHLAALDQLTTADVFAALPDLEELSIRSCRRLRTLPQAALPALETLEILELDSLANLALGAGELPSLRDIDVRSLPLLTGLDALPGCTSLLRLSLDELPALAALPDLTHLADLRVVTLRDLPGLDRLDDLAGLAPHTLTLDAMPALTDLSGLTSLPRLRWLEVENCGSLESLAGAAALPRLRSVMLTDNPRLTRFGDVAFASGIEDLTIAGCGFTDLSSFAGVTDCASLTLSRCADLESLAGLAAFLALESLRLEQLPALGSLGAVANFPGLRNLSFSGCGEIVDLAGIGSVPALGNLTVQTCPALRTLAGPGYPAVMGMVRISDNPVLESLTALADVTSINDLTITYNTSLGDEAAQAFADGLEFVQWAYIYGNDP